MTSHHVGFDYIVLSLYTTMENCDLCEKTEVGSDLINFVRLSVIKNRMTLIGHNTSANWEAIRSENLIKRKLTTTSVVSWYEISKHVSLRMTDLSDLRLFYGSCQLFSLLDMMPNSFPVIKIIEIVLLSISSTGDGIISSYHTQGFKMISPVCHSI